jgi:hypothetical protein
MRVARDADLDLVLIGGLAVDGSNGEQYYDE